MYVSELVQPDFNCSAHPRHKLSQRIPPANHFIRPCSATLASSTTFQFKHLSLLLPTQAQHSPWILLFCVACTSFVIVLFLVSISPPTPTCIHAAGTSIPSSFTARTWKWFCLDDSDDRSRTSLFTIPSITSIVHNLLSWVFLMHPPLTQGWERFEVSKKDESENPNAVYRRMLDVLSETCRMISEQSTGH